jgi:hypothetical protein
MSTTARRGARIGFAAAIAWIVLGAESAWRGGEMHYRDVLVIVPWTLTLITFWHLHALQRSGGSRLERWSFITVVTAMTLVLVGGAGVLLDVDPLKILAFPLGALLFLAAMVAFGIATARAGAVPRYVGVALALLEPGALLTGLLLSPILPIYDRGSYYGGVEKGLIILLLARASWRSAAEHRQQLKASEAPEALVP